MYPSGNDQLGELSKAFTAAKLVCPFTVYTPWRKVFGQPRSYAVVLRAVAVDLAELLVKNGLVRIYGTRTVLPNASTSRQYLPHLRELETLAKAGTARRLENVTQTACALEARSGITAS